MGSEYNRPNIVLGVFFLSSQSTPNLMFWKHFMLANERIVQQSFFKYLHYK